MTYIAESRDALIRSMRMTRVAGPAGDLLAGPELGIASRAVVTADTLAALADKWEQGNYQSGAFYPEASAYDDGQRVRAEACADELRDALSERGQGRG